MPGVLEQPTEATGSRSWPRLVLFDLDDTLCDYAAARLVRLRIAFAGSDPASPLVDGDVLDRLIAASLASQPHGSDHFADLFQSHGVGDEQAARWARDWYVANRFHGLRLFPDALATVAAVRARSAGSPVRIGVITNGPADVQREKVVLLGVDGVADFVLVSGEFGAWKPDPSIFLAALSMAAVSAGDAVMVGDSLEHDIAGARAVGIRTVWVDRGDRPRRHDDAMPDATIRSLAELPALLHRWQSAMWPLQK
jgi:putative hydrolase of the HAD superfamily